MLLIADPLPGEALDQQAQAGRLPGDGLLRLHREGARCGTLRFARESLPRELALSELTTGAVSGKPAIPAGDWLRRRHPDARVVSVASEQASAELLAGRLGQARWSGAGQEAGTAQHGRGASTGEQVVELARAALRDGTLGKDDLPDLLIVDLASRHPEGEPPAAAAAAPLRELAPAGERPEAMPAPSLPPSSPAPPEGRLRWLDRAVARLLAVLDSELGAGGYALLLCSLDQPGPADGAMWALGAGLTPRAVAGACDAGSVAPTLLAWLGLDPLPIGSPVALPWAAPPPPPPAPQLRLTLLHTNDHHGQDMDHAVPGGKGQAGGLAMRAAMITRLRRTAAAPDHRVLLLDAGDVSTGACAATRLHARSSLEAMELMGYDAMALGNHEFDQILATTLGELDRVSLPVLSINARWREDDRLLVKPVQRVTLAGHPVAILGLTTPETPETSTLGDDPRLRFDGLEETTRRWVAALRPQVELLIALTHQGLERDRQLARDVPGIDLIVGGHSHDALPQPVIENGVPILQAGANGAFLGHAELELAAAPAGRKRSVRLASYELLSVPVAGAGGLEPDPEVARQIERHWSTVADQCAAPVGRVLGRFERRPLAGPGSGSTLGHLVADSVRWRARTDVALQNEGSLRDDLPAGEVTLGAVQSALPFSNTIVRIEMSGEELMQVLAELARRPAADMGFLHVSGLTWVIESSTPRDVLVAGKPLDASTRYTVGVNSFLARGGDNHHLLARLGRKVDTGFDATQALADYIAARGTLSPDTNLRVRRIGP